MIEGFHAQLVTGDATSLPQRFADLAKVESHCSSAKRGGDLGDFGYAAFLHALSPRTLLQHHIFCLCSVQGTVLHKDCLCMSKSLDLSAHANILACHCFTATSFPV